MEKKIWRTGKKTEMKKLLSRTFIYLYTFSFLNLVHNLASLVERIPTPLHHNIFT